MYPRCFEVAHQSLGVASRDLKDETTDGTKRDLTIVFF